MRCIAGAIAVLTGVLVSACGARQHLSTPAPLTTGWSTPLDHMAHHSWALHIDRARVHLTAIQGDEASVRVVRIQPASGRILWQSDVDIPGCLQPHLSSHEALTAVACGSHVAALDASTGQVAWRASATDERLVDRLSVGDDVVVAAFAGGGVDAFDVAQGHRHELGVPPDAAVVVLAERDGDVFVVTREDDEGRPTLATWRIGATSTRLWDAPTSGGAEPPLLVEDVLYARNTQGEQLGYALGSGRVVVDPWQPTPIGLRVGALRISQEEVAGVLLTMRRLDARGPGDEDPRWSTHLVSNRELSPMVMADQQRAILVGSGERYHLLDARTGRVRWSASVGDAMNGDGCSTAGSDGRTVFVVCTGIDASSVSAVPTEPSSSR